MPIQYIVSETPDGTDVISYTQDGLTYTFLEDLENPYYQAYLASLNEPA
jgi:hypothetical protein